MKQRGMKLIMRGDITMQIIRRLLVKTKRRSGTIRDTTGGPGIVLAATVCLLFGGCASGPSRQSADAIFFPPLPQTPRVQYLTSVSSEADLGLRKQSRFKDFVVGSAGGELQFGQLQAVAFGAGKIYVVDKTMENVISVDLETGAFEPFRDLTGGRLESPVSIMVDAHGYKYVADVKRNEVVVFNERNEFSTTFAAPPPFRPVDAAVYGDRLFVCDFEGNQVVVFDRATGEILDTIGGIGVDEGNFRRPTHLAIDVAGNLFVVDSMNFRIQMFNDTGDFVKTFGWYEAGPGGLARPKGISVDRSGHLYSVDGAFEVIQIFDVTSTDPLLFWGQRGMGPGSTYLPSDIAIDYDNVAYFSKLADPDFELEYLIYQTNQLGENKLNVFGFGTWTGRSSDIMGPIGVAPEQAEEPGAMPSLDDLTEQ